MSSSIGILERYNRTVAYPQTHSSTSDFGTSVDVSNCTAAVSQPTCESGRRCRGGQVFILKKNETDWVLHQTIFNPFHSRSVYFGSIVRLHNEWLAIVASNATYRTTQTGLVHMYRWSDVNQTYVRHTHIRPRNSQSNLDFAVSISIGNEIILVGAPGYNSNTHHRVGVVYWYRRSVNDSWRPRRYPILSPNPGANENFGYSVSLWEDIACIGNNPSSMASQAVYVMQYDGTSWTLLQTLSNNLRSGFGTKLVFRHGILAVASPSDSTNVAGAGSVSIYELDNAPSFQLQTVVESETPTANKAFGWDLDVTNSRVVIGNNACPDPSNCQQGFAHITRLINGAWQPEAEIGIGAQSGQDRFGVCVAIWDDTVIIGAPKSMDSLLQKGAAYILDRNTP
eukprot:TRINITY_DN5264_c0_g1_i2.p1 TRINITY_DN5264_c0_g1~~TRINITY_DN5264_c0_g1_i2.p1  ORF type:complete len:396 (-),score=56.97 TRINITY_DN5264_c0_g1_i2:230-1417(-)